MAFVTKMYERIDLSQFGVCDLSKIGKIQNLQICREQYEINFQVLVKAFSVTLIRNLWNAKQ